MGKPEAVGAVVPAASAQASELAPAVDAVLTQRRDVWLLTAAAIALLLSTVI